MQVTGLSTEMSEEDQQPPGILFPVLGEAKSNQAPEATLTELRDRTKSQVLIQIFDDCLFVRKFELVFCMNFSRQIFFTYDIGQGWVQFQHKETKGREKFESQSLEEVKVFVEKMKTKCSQQNFSSIYSLLQKKSTSKSSEVYIAQRKYDMELFAVKVQKDSSKVEQEIYIMKKLKHPNLIYFQEYFIEPDNTTYIVMDYENGGSLLERMKSTAKFTYKQKLKVVMDMLNALQFLRIKGIVHRDIKPENILYSEEDGNYKIADFGLALDCGEKIIKKSGTPGYMAPETLDQDKQGVANILSDVYSMGLTFFEIFTGVQYFSGEGSEQILKNNLKATSFRSRKYKSQDQFKVQKKLLQKMIRRKPQDRKNSMQIMEDKTYGRISRLYGKQNLALSSSQTKTKSSESQEDNIVFSVKKLFKIKTVS